MTRLKNVETVSLLNTAKLFLQKILGSEALSDFKTLPADEEIVQIVSFL